MVAEIRSCLFVSTRAAWIAAALVGTCLVCASARAQPLIKFAAPALRGPAAAPGDAVKAADDKAAEAEKKFPGGAPLKTDPELEQLLIRAEQFAADGRFDLAAVLWQKVLDETGDTLFTRDGRTYFGLSAEVERILKETSEEALRVYRVTADGEAQAVLAAGEQASAAPGGGKDAMEKALAKVVGRYFLSSFGDDAAYRLGCLALDRHDFVGAYRLFTKILDQHPDPSMPRSALLLRIGVASSRIGDHASAATAIAAAEAESDAAPAGLVAEVKKDAARAKTSAASQATGSADYRMILGGPERRGVMPSLPAEITKASLREQWTLSFPTATYATSEAQLANRVRISRMGGAQPIMGATTPEAMIDRWSKNRWTPAGQLLFAEGKVFIKTNNDLACWEIASPSEKPLWRSTWINLFKVDPQSAILQQFAQNGAVAGAAQRPVGDSEVQFFGDRIHQSMSIAEGMIFNIEGVRVARYSKSGQGAAPNQNNVGFQYGVTPRRSRKNWLAAYELSTGRAKWRRGADDTAKNDDTEVGFMAAPVPYGNLLLAPVSDGGAIWLYGLTAADGVTAWKTYLCDEPTGGCAPWSPVCVSVSGSDAYVLCGAGVVFSVDAVSGAIRYAVRYTRDGEANQQMQNWGYGATTLLNLRGFEDDAAIPFGRALIVMASDHDEIFALDRRSGEVLWRTPRTPFDQTVSYCLGIAEGGLFVAGSGVVRRYDAAGGKLMWERPMGEMGEMYGRGALTADALYMPVKGQVGGAVVKLDLKTGNVLAQAGVKIARPTDGQESGEQAVSEASNDPPLGSLFSDGQKLWMLSGHRVSMLADDNYERRTLERRIEGGDSAARIERARLWLSQDRLDEALADLEAAYRRPSKERDQGFVVEAALKIVADQRLHRTDPQRALVLCNRLVEWERAASRPIGAGLLAALRGAVEALSNVAVEEGPAEVLRAANEFPADFWPVAARAAARSSTSDHADLLSKAIAGSAAELAVAAEAFARVAPASAAPALAAHAAHANPWTRLAVARGLAACGERQALETFAKLLDEPDPRLRTEADFALRGLTGEDVRYDPFSSPETRVAGRELWTNWIAASGATAKLATLDLASAEAGYTLVSRGDQGAIEFDRQGNERRKIAVSGAIACQALASGNALFSLETESGARLVEIDQAGKEVWISTEAKYPSASVERQADGNTLVACPQDRMVAEILAARGGYALRFTPAERTSDAHRLPGGDLLLAMGGSDEGRIVETSPLGQERWSLGGFPGIVRARRLPSGHLLVVQSSGNVVSEVEESGKIVWKRDGLNTPTDAFPLPSGHALIVDLNRLMEVDAQGAVLWEKEVNGASGVSRY